MIYRKVANSRIVCIFIYDTFFLLWFNSMNCYSWFIESQWEHVVSCMQHAVRDSATFLMSKFDWRSFFFLFLIVLYIPDSSLQWCFVGVLVHPDFYKWITLKLDKSDSDTIRTDIKVFHNVTDEVHCSVKMMAFNTSRTVNNKSYIKSRSFAFY